MASAIPTTHLVPLFWASMDSSGANTASANYPTILVGQLLSGGTGSADVVYQVTTPGQVSELFGAGSQLHRMALAYFANDPAGEVWVYALADSGAYATGKITVAGTASADGVLHLEIAGQALPIAVSDGDTAADIHAAIAAALPVHSVTPTDYPVSAANNTTYATLTCKWKGATGNNIKLAINPLGSAGRQVTPAGLTCVITNKMGALAAGSGGGVIDNFATNCATFDLDHLVLGCPDTSDTLVQLGTEFNDTVGRWSYLRQQYGHVWACEQATSSEHATFLDDLNDQHVTWVGVEGNYAAFDPKVSAPTYEIAAAYAGRCAASLRADPALPCQTLELSGSTDGKVRFKAPAMADRWGVSTRNSLLGDGCATVMYTRDGKILVERETTTYTENAYGSPDNSYQDAQVLFCNSFWLRGLRTMVESNFGRAKLTTSILAEIKGAIIAKYAEYEALGITSDTDTFAESLSVEVNNEDPNRLDCLASPDFVNQFRVFALTNKFSR